MAKRFGRGKGCVDDDDAAAHLLAERLRGRLLAAHDRFEALTRGEQQRGVDAGGNQHLEPPRIERADDKVAQRGDVFDVENTDSVVHVACSQHSTCRTQKYGESPAQASTLRGAGAALPRLNFVPLILCVDDDPDFLELVCRTFTDDGLTVVGAPSAEAALAMCGERAVDLLVTDLNLPREGGLELIAQLRKRDSRMQVVVLTAVVSSVLTCEAIELGAAAYLTKPVDLFHLREVVNDLLGTRPSAAAE
jgi:CheY-like chemotaxis protein